MKPNIFDYATSELSQDAFLAWFFKWAEKENEKEDQILNTCAKECLKKFLGNICPSEINSVKIYRQWGNIDLWITVNDKVHLIIEDKTGTSEHHNQLIRYKEIAREWYESECGIDFDNHFSFVYYKSGDITPNERDRVSKAQYTIINRTELLSVFGKYEISNQIFLDYKAKIQRKQNLQDSVFNIPFEDVVEKKNKSEYVKGFYNVLVPELDSAYWRLVNSPSKQYYGMWWYWCEWSYGTLYLQFDEFDLQIRLCDIKKTNNRSFARNKAYTLIINVVEESDYKGLIKKPKRFGTGASMAIVKIDKSLWLSLDENGYLDMKKIIEKLHKLEFFLWETVLGN